VGLFNQKNPKSGEQDPKAAPDDRTSSPVGTSSVAQSTRRSQPSIQGEEDVANIGKSISIKGDLTGNEDIVVEGTVEGKIDLPNNQLTVGANGTVRAEVNAKGIVVIGRVSGNVNGSERVEIQATGIVEGDVVAPKLIVAEGAVVNGSIRMSKKPGSGETAKPAGPDVRKAG
jgi:cytoskeletal protein CcmA (bactofilin family)